MKSVFKNILIKGPVGRIQAKYLSRRDEKSPSVLICGPHPQSGKKFSDPVMSSFILKFIRCNYNVLFFNYRSIAGSEGAFCNDFDGVEDALHCFDWLMKHNSLSRFFCVAGYEYGTYPALELLTRRPEVNDFVIVDPLPAYTKLNSINNYTASGSIVINNQDASLSPGQVAQLKAHLETFKGTKVDIIKNNALQYGIGSHLKLIDHSPTIKML